MGEQGRSLRWIRPVRQGGFLKPAEPVRSPQPEVPGQPAWVLRAAWAVPVSPA